MENKNKYKNQKNKKNSEDDTTINVEKTDPLSTEKAEMETLIFNFEGENVDDKEDPLTIFTPTKTLNRSPPKPSTSTPINPVNVTERNLILNRNQAVRPRSHSASEVAGKEIENEKEIIDLGQFSPEEEREIKKRKRETGVGAGSRSNTSNQASSLNLAVKALSLALKDLSSYKQDVKSEIRLAIINTIKTFNTKCKEK